MYQQKLSILRGYRSQPLGRPLHRRCRIVTEFSRYDMVAPIIDRSTNKALVSPSGAPYLVALAQFKPSRVSAEPAMGNVAVRMSQEGDNGAAIAPDVYLTQYGQWSNHLIRTFPEGYDIANPASDMMLVLRPAQGQRGYHLFAFSPSTDAGTETTGGVEVFNLDAYDNLVAAGGRYPFSQAIVSAGLASQARKDVFVPFSVDPNTGKILASFNITEVGDPNQPAPPEPNNLPAVQATANTPLTDSGAGAVYSPLDTAGTYDVNSCFDRVWNENPGLRPEVHRFIDLRATTQSDGTPGPLDVLDGFARASIVPGSEEVMGPDQNPGPGYGLPVRYTRVTRNPGRNQYRINYVDQVEPSDYSLLGVPAPPASYTATDLSSAVIQARYKAGYVQLCSDPTIPVPTGSVKVFYRFQFTRPGDRIAVDYDSRQVMDVLLTLKNYDATSVASTQSVTLTANATIRNLLR